MKKKLVIRDIIILFRLYNNSRRCVADACHVERNKKVPQDHGQRAVSRAEHVVADEEVTAAACCRPLSVRLTSVEDLGTTEAPPWQSCSSSSRHSSCIVEASTFDLRNDEPDGVRLKWPDGVDCDTGWAGEGWPVTGGCWSRTTADCCARLPPAMLVCNRSRLKSYRAADRSSPRGRNRSDWRSGGRRTAAGCGCVVAAGTAAVIATAGTAEGIATGCWPSNRFFDSWMAAYRSIADRPDAGRNAYGCCCGDRPAGLARPLRQSRIGDMLLVLMSIRPALWSFFTGVDADTFRSWPRATLRSRLSSSRLVSIKRVHGKPNVEYIII